MAVPATIPEGPAGRPEDGRSTGTRARPAPLVSVARGALMLLSTQPLTWTTTLLTAVVVPRFLGAEGLGLNALALTIAGVAGLVASLGVPTSWMRRVAMHGDDAIRHSGAAFLVLTVTALLIGGALSLALPLTGMRAYEVTVIRVALLGMVLSTGQSVVSYTLLGQERHATYAWLNAIGVMATAAAGIIVLLAGGDVLAFVTAGVATSAVMLAVNWRIAGFRLHRGSLDRAVWIRLVQGGAPFLATGIVTWIYAELHKVFLAALAGAASVGWYAAAFRIVAIPVVIPTLITTPLLPVLSRQVGEEASFGRTLRHSLAVVIILIIPVAAMILAVAPAIPGLLGWPTEFRHSIPVMMILAVQQPLVAVDMVLGAGVIALHRERRWFRLAVVAALVNPPLNLALIPFFDGVQHNGAIGAALATVATELLMCVGAVRLLPRGMLGRETASLSARVVLAGLGLVLVTMTLRPMSLPLAVLAGGATYLAAVVVLRVVRPMELWAARRIAVRSLLDRSVEPVL